MKRVINFTKLRFLMISLSLLLIIAGGVGFYLKGGFNLGIDFTAGLSQQIRINPVGAAAPIEKVRQAMSGIEGLNLQVIGDPASQEFIVKVQAPQDDRDFQEKMEMRIFDSLGDEFGQANIEIRSTDFVGPRYSEDLLGQALSITMVALVLILLYTAFRFHFIFAAAAVICLLHDVAIMLGVLAVFQLEVTTTTAAAILTIIGYSLNDTIVIFDRVRENRSLLRDADLATIINTSITQSLGRTILTSLTTLIAVVSVYIFGTGEIRSFALNLIIGVVVGTYSTVFIASSIVLGWQRAIERRRRAIELKKFGRLPARPDALKVEEKAPVVEAPEPEKRQSKKVPIAVTRSQPMRKKRKKKKS
jgi:preprotein translocase subunit SecF